MFFLFIIIITILYIFNKFNYTYFDFFQNQYYTTCPNNLSISYSLNPDVHKLKDKKCGIYPYPKCKSDYSQKILPRFIKSSPISGFNYNCQSCPKGLCVDTDNQPYYHDPNCCKKKVGCIGNTGCRYVDNIKYFQP